MLICVYKDKYLGYNSKLYWFSELAVVRSLLGSLASPAMDSRLGLQCQA